jgi:hypothetical protein
VKGVSASPTVGRPPEKASNSTAGPECVKRQSPLSAGRGFRFSEAAWTAEGRVRERASGTGAEVRLAKQKWRARQDSNPRPLGS